MSSTILYQIVATYRHQNRDSPECRPLNYLAEHADCWLNYAPWGRPSGQQKGKAYGYRAFERVHRLGGAWLLPSLV
jgi:hypothetical protein